MSSSFVDIALPVPLHRSFTYSLPPELASLAHLGSRALVPFGKKQLTGIIVGFPSQSSVKGLRPVTDILDLVPTFPDEMLQLARWMSEYYFVPLGEVLRSATPQGLSLETKQTIRLVPSSIAEALEQTSKNAQRRHRILVALQGSSLTVAQLQKRVGGTGLSSVLADMASKGWIQLEQSFTKGVVRPKTVAMISISDRSGDVLARLSRPLTKKQSALLEHVRASKGPLEQKELLRRAHASLAVLRALISKELLLVSKKEVDRSASSEQPDAIPAFSLNPSQSAALGEIDKALNASAYKAFLLHGITGSGKTQVYIESIRRALSLGKTAIVLVPEISLTPQTVRRFRAYFGNEVAVMHSQMSVGERYDAWRSAHEGKVRIVIGPRSAIFAPLANLGLVVVDEEHESSYKQYDATPRYQARDVAIVRATINKAVALLGSATPSAESYYNSHSGKYHLLSLPDRVDTAKLPRIDIVDMASERKRVYAEVKAKVRQEGIRFPARLPSASVSKLLRDQITSRLAKKEGIILLQNRRGYSHVVECFDCGYVERCDNCDVSLTFHAAKKHLRCHYCGLVKKPPSVCPSCGGIEIRFHAFGTQQVHEELERLFPDADIARMDLDTTTLKGSHARILGRFERGEADILLGTQMVAKGLDFPRVTLVGVISADTQMLLPDFRSSERTFQILTQVSGRAGRSTLAGEVVIQTLQPDHYCLKHVVSHDFRGFYEEELEYRRQLDYPPFSRIIVAEFKGKKEGQVLDHARSFAEHLRRATQAPVATILGPSEPGIPRVKGLYRRLVVIKNLKKTDPSGALLRKPLRAALAHYEETLGKTRSVSMSIDVDPQGMM